MTKKFTVVARLWFDRVNGNTYHAIKVINNKNGDFMVSGFVYGYGECYKQTALVLLSGFKWIPRKYRNEKNLYLYERENNYPINWIVQENCRKKDLLEFGK